jgi:hypothetical protein
MDLTKASVHDIHYLNEVKHSGIINCTLNKDKAYISEPIQLDLPNTSRNRLQTPMRSNQHDKEPFSSIFKKSRKRIVKPYSPSFAISKCSKENNAKTLSGLSIRILCKDSSVTMLQYINFFNKKPLNHLKYALTS